MSQCFFFVEHLPDDPNPFNGTIRALCVEHGREQKGAWFYDGQIGPWTVKCYHCGEIIHQHDEDKDEVSN